MEKSKNLEFPKNLLYDIFGEDRHRHQDISIDCPYITFYANKYENEGLIDIVYDIANNPKYTHLHIQFIDENHCETDDQVMWR